MEKLREKMVAEIRRRYGFDDHRVLNVMLRIPREEFILSNYRKKAYADMPVNIGFGQTISQPFTVALMTHLVVSNKKLEIRHRKQKSNILEIGTGSGYQSAVLSNFFDEVFTIEIIPELALHARTVLASLGYKNIHVRVGSGEWGWKEHSPFDAVIVTAGMDKVPEELFNQLKTGGVLVAPVGYENKKTMIRYTKEFMDQRTEELKKEEFGSFNFVPFVR
jgi:protein-L-isoaspartate(D-aspartate) O-methyltransferase